MSADESRAAFEEAWIKRGMYRPFISSEPGYEDCYADPLARNGWVMWQAALLWQAVRVPNGSITLVKVTDEEERAMQAVYRTIDEQEDAQNCDICSGINGHHNDNCAGAK